MDTRALRTPVCLLISLAIVGWLGHCITQTNSHLHEIAAGAGADGSLSLTAQQLQDDEERSPARKGRSLLQNPDKPSLNKYGGLTMEKMVVGTGYPLEEHKVITPDGWVLNLYRIPHGKNRNTQRGRKPVAYVHHGITLSSACFTLLGEHESIAYILADAGFDVWLPNTRSNMFSRGNFKHSHRDVEYWYHSFDQYALIDNPAMINKALEVSGASKLAFVGHSQGATIAYAMLASLPEMNDKISVSINMGASVFMKYIKAPFLGAYARKRNDKALANTLSGEFLWYRMLAPIIPQCKENLFAETCAAGLNYLFYGPSVYISIDDFVVITQTWPANVASRNLGHFAQMMTMEGVHFQRYDHGTNCSRHEPFYETCNQQEYGSMEPPQYDMSRITAPQVFMSGELDIMSTPEDVNTQRARLQPGVLKAEYVYQSYAHMDYVWDRNARHAFDLVDILYRYSPGTY